MAVRYLPTRPVRDLRELIQRAADEHGDRPAFRDLDPAGAIHTYTFAQLRADVAALGTALIDRGIAGRHVALVGESAYSYVVSYLAVANSGGVIVPLDKELTVGELVHLVDKSDAEAFMYGATLASDADEIVRGCPRVATSIAISLYPGSDLASNHPGTIGPSAPDEAATDRPGPSAEQLRLPELLQAGRELIARGDTRYRDVTVDPDVMCAILFTSGTTGANKGVMLCPRNITSVIAGAFALHRFPTVSLSVLPISHSYEFDLHVLGAIYGGVTLCFNDSVMHVRDNLTRFAPEMSLMVPMIVESLHKTIWREAEKNHLDRHLRYAVHLSNALRKLGIDARRLFFKPVRQSLGGRMTTIVCGGAPLRPEIAKGMSDLGIDVYNGYGITECSPLISSNCVVADVPGSVGVPIPGIEVRIDSPDGDGNGEIQVRGDNVMLGYYGDPEATARSFTADGWFKTGDLGHLGRRGAIFVTGRQKNLIILPNGKNVQPEELEEHLLASIDYLREVVVHTATDGTGPERIVATAFLDTAFVLGIGHEAAAAKFQTDVARLNRQLAAYKQIHRTQLRDCEFVKTSTKKIKRLETQGAS